MLIKRGINETQASFPKLVQVLVDDHWLGTAVSESRAAFARFHFHPSWSRQGIAERMTMEQRCLLNSQTELAKHFQCLACSMPGMGRTELTAASEYLPEGGKLQGDKKIGVSLNS